MTHTQGPWGVNALAANNANIYLTGLDGTKSPLGYIVQTATAPIAAMIETKADARLIAAAPELLATLETAYKHFLQHMERDWFDDDDQDVMQQMFDAISKAEGN